MRINLSITVIIVVICVNSLFAQPLVKVKKADQKKDILMMTSKGKLILRLNDSTQLHRDNFIRLIKYKYYKKFIDKDFKTQSTLVIAILDEMIVVDGKGLKIPINQIDAKIAVHRLVTQDVLILLSSALWAMRKLRAN